MEFRWIRIHVLVQKSKNQIINVYTQYTSIGHIDSILQRVSFRLLQTKRNQKLVVKFKRGNIN